MAVTLTVKQIAEKYSYTALWVRSLARRGKIPAVRQGHKWLFDADEVEKALVVKNSFKEKPIEGSDAGTADSL